jgi:two-component sensor histidine kinase
VKEPRLHDLLRESESRVMAMALIYDRLSHEGAVAGIAFHAYLRQLVTGLFQAYGVRPGRIELVAELEEVFLNLDTAVPCALIATELVSNAIKFAFPDEREGQVHIELHRDGGEGRFRLSVSDSGIGLPRGFDFEKATSTGMGLMRDLVRQLNGRIEFVTDPAQGTTAKVIFFQAGYSGALA